MNSFASTVAEPAFSPAASSRLSPRCGRFCRSMLCCRIAKIPGPMNATAWPLIGKCRWCRAVPVPACRVVLRRLPMAWCSPACATSPFPTRLRHTACITRRTRRRRSPAPSAATLPRIPAASIVLKYGPTFYNVLCVRIVTIDGEIVELGIEGLDAPGLDLLAVFIGSKGMLGVVIEVTVKLIPKSQTARVIMASFDDVVKGGNAVANVISAGIIPEMMDRTSSRMVEPFVKAGAAGRRRVTRLCAGRRPDGWQGRHSALRWSGHEERCRLRCIALAGRLARHVGLDP